MEWLKAETSKMLKSWIKLAQLSVEAQQVIWLRTMKLAAGGPKADREAKLMVQEKIDIAQKEALKLMMGGSQDAMVGNYRRKVKANRKRLSK
jgi:hypothetical protein